MHPNVHRSTVYNSQLCIFKVVLDLQGKSTKVINVNTAKTTKPWKFHWLAFGQDKSEFISLFYHLIRGFPSGSDGKDSVPSVGDLGSIPGSGRSPGEGKLELCTPAFLPGKAHGQRSLAGYSPWGRRVKNDYHTQYLAGFPGGASGKEPDCQCRRLQFDSWVGKIVWRKEWQPAPVFWPGESHGQRSLTGYSPWDHKLQARLRWLSLHT